jgi:hypothetical protein
VDALEECVDPDGLLKALKVIWKSGQQNLRLFLSSRMGVDVKARFPEVVEVNMGMSNTEDIKYYLRTDIERRRPEQTDPPTPKGVSDFMVFKFVSLKSFEMTFFLCF